MFESPRLSMFKPMSQKCDLSSRMFSAGANKMKDADERTGQRPRVRSNAPDCHSRSTRVATNLKPPDS